MKRLTQIAVVAAAMFAMPGCADAQGLALPSSAGAIAGVLKQGEGLIAGARDVERQAEAKLAHDRVDGAVYELCERATVGEMDRLLASRPGLKPLRQQLCQRSIAD